MNESSYITVTGGDAFNVTSQEDARDRRDQLLKETRSLDRVVTREDAAYAAETLKQATLFVRMVEASRVEVKAPFLEYGKRIDSVARDLTANPSANLTAEIDRVSRLLGGYQALENAKAEAARRAAYEEERRIREEAAEKIRHAEEHSRNQASEDKKVAAIEDRAERQIIETRVAASQVAAPKQEGVGTRSKVVFEITDIVALYEAAPYLVNLVPNTAAINGALKTMPEGKSLPGVKWHRENVSIVR